MDDYGRPEPGDESRRVVQRRVACRAIVEREDRRRPVDVRDLLHERALSDLARTEYYSDTGVSEGI